MGKGPREEFLDTEVQMVGNRVSRNVKLSMNWLFVLNYRLHRPDPDSRSTSKYIKESQIILMQDISAGHFDKIFSIKGIIYCRMFWKHCIKKLRTFLSQFIVLPVFERRAHSIFQTFFWPYLLITWGVLLHFLTQLQKCRSECLRQKG